MGGFDHRPAEPSSELSAETISRNTRWGLRLFAIYFAFYGAFVLINAFRPDWMDTVVAGGVNLAVVYGLALIAVALIVALIYGWICRDAGEPDSADSATHAARRGTAS
jgi:uncharacterized membrane protein (DUF485 family)